MPLTPAWPRCWPAACSSRISTASAAKRSCSSIRRKRARSRRSSARAGRRSAVDVDWYVSRRKTLDGAGLDPAVVPGALHAALTVLEKWGTMSFEEVAARAIQYAEHGFPMRTSTARAIEQPAEVLRALARQPALLAEAGRHDVQAGRDDQAADARAHAAADGRGRTRRQGARAGPPASSPRAIASTKATSPARWWRSCRSTARRST